MFSYSRDIVICQSIRIHATIERFIKDKTIWAPNEWPPLIRNSKINKKSIEVKEQKFQNLLYWKKNADEVLPKLLKDTEKIL